MPKIYTLYTTTIPNAIFYPKILSEEEIKEHESLGFKVIDIPQDVIDKWKEHQKQVEHWNDYWSDVDDKLWED
jgi:hypothetical protein